MPSHPTSPTRTLRDYIGIAARGFCMGAADIVPGVSGGTMAFILGIYQELLDSIKAVDVRVFALILKLKFREAVEIVPWRFLISLGLGISVAIVTLAHFLETQLGRHPTRVWAFFFGLVLASVLTVSRNIPQWTTRSIITAILAVICAYLFVGASTLRTPDTAWFLFLSGALAVVAMILPGISGAYILLILGKYRFVLSAVNDGDILSLAIVASGAILGLMIFARFLSWVLNRYHDPTVAALTGLMLGSLRKIWPWKDAMTNTNPVFPATLNTEVIITIIAGVTGFVLVLLITRIAARPHHPPAATPS